MSLTKKVMNGELNGEIVWICDYMRRDLNKKPLRSIQPVKCIVVDNDDLPKNKIVYYSESHYRPIGKNGNPTSRIISPVDTTGYRGYCGNMLFTSHSENECVEKFKSLVDIVMCEWKDKLKTAELEILTEMKSLNDMLDPK